METRKLGNGNLEVSALGLGCMGMSWSYGAAKDKLMYPQTTLSNEFVHDGYEATYGTIQVDTAKHHILYHVEASATRDKLVGQTETLSYELPDAHHIVIRPADPTQHWSVTWERYP